MQALTAVPMECAKRGIACVVTATRASAIVEFETNKKPLANENRNNGRNENKKQFVEPNPIETSVWITWNVAVRQWSGGVSQLSPVKPQCFFRF